MNAARGLLLWGLLGCLTAQGCQVLLAVDPRGSGGTGGLVVSDASPDFDGQTAMPDAQASPPEAGSVVIPDANPHGDDASVGAGPDASTSVDPDAAISTVPDASSLPIPDASNDAGPDASDASDAADGSDMDADSGCSDTDNDGVCDSNDLCTGNDATGDSDIDGICDSDDLCSGNDLAGDSDGDGLCDDIDTCPTAATPTDCSGTCADLSTNQSNCRTCGHACSGSESCSNATCIYVGAPPPLSFVLRWTDVPSDLELFVRTPLGNTITYLNTSADGGTRYVGSSKGPGAEQVMWTAAPPSGTYEVCVIGRLAGNNGTAFSVDVLVNNVVVQSGSGTAFRQGAPPATTCAASDGTHVLSYDVP